MLLAPRRCSLAAAPELQSGCVLAKLQKPTSPFAAPLTAAIQGCAVRRLRHEIPLPQRNRSPIRHGILSLQYNWLVQLSTGASRSRRRVDAMLRILGSSVTSESPESSDSAAFLSPSLTDSSNYISPFYISSFSLSCFFAPASCPCLQKMQFHTQPRVAACTYRMHLQRRLHASRVAAGRANKDAVNKLLARQMVFGSDRLRNELPRWHSLNYQCVCPRKSVHPMPAITFPYRARARGLCCCASLSWCST